MTEIIEEFYTLEDVNTAIGYLLSYLDGRFKNTEPVLSLLEPIDFKDESFDYRFSVLHRLFEFFRSQIGHGNFSDMNNWEWNFSRDVHFEIGQFYHHSLETANSFRQPEWDTEDKIEPWFRALEYAGEAGEVANVVKKLERERLGIKGSRDTVEHLAEEVADGFISLTLLAQEYDIDIASAIARKFNATSNANDLKTKLFIPIG